MQTGRPVWHRNNCKKTIDILGKFCWTLLRTSAHGTRAKTLDDAYRTFRRINGRMVMAKGSRRMKSKIDRSCRPDLKGNRAVLRLIFNLTFKKLHYKTIDAASFARSLQFVKGTEGKIRRIRSSASLRHSPVLPPPCSPERFVYDRCNVDVLSDLSIALSEWRPRICSEILVLFKKIA
jgi:hypothetical protein